ncbi:MAG TPA: hydroxymethylbilane synthase [Pseudomonadales bacterium]
MRERIVIATRESPLALWQAEFIRDELRRSNPQIEVTLLGMTTHGDRWLSSPLSQVGGKGLFIKELEEAILDGRADAAVHSMKDVPAELPEAFALPLVGYRADVRDALVVPSGMTLRELPPGAVVGSSSLRRQAMLLAQRPDLIVKPVRGNVGTRLEKLDAGEYDALVLAAAGLERLGLADRITERLPVEVSVPAAGQGALGVECRADDAELAALLGSLEEAAVADCVLAERAVSAGIGADCSAPLGAHAVVSDRGIHLRARLASPDGGHLLEAEATGLDARDLGRTVAEALLDQGARELLARITRD